VNEPLTLTVEEAAKLLGVSRGTAYEAARRGELPTIRLGRRLLVPRARLYELVGAHTNGKEVLDITRADENPQQSETRPQEPGFSTHT
jgi:excisionase family DNA binding protein